MSLSCHCIEKPLLHRGKCLSKNLGNGSPGWVSSNTARCFCPPSVGPLPDAFTPRPNPPHNCSEWGPTWSGRPSCSAPPASGKVRVLSAGLGFMSWSRFSGQVSKEQTSIRRLPLICSKQNINLNLVTLSIFQLPDENWTWKYLSENTDMQEFHTMKN